MHGAASKARVVIIGAGFGGLAAAKALRGSDATVTLVDRTNHNLFQPLLYQVATAALAPSDIAKATRSILSHQRNLRVLLVAATGVDVSAREVELEDGSTLPFDYLILATGSAYSFFGHAGWSEHAHVLKTIEDALSVRQTLLSAFEQAERAPHRAEIRDLLTFVIVGGGPTGVELAGTIAELARSTLVKDFRRVDPASARIVLCEAGPRLLNGFSERLSAYALEALEALDVEVLLDQPVNEITAEGLHVGGRWIRSKTILWCGGTKARPAAAWLGAPAARNGGVIVHRDCSVPAHPNIFAIGDVASFEPEGLAPLPGVAPVAKQQGAYVGRLITARIAGTPFPREFRFRDLGTMAVIGRARAIAVIGRVELTGFSAWLTWSLVHLTLLVDFRGRLFVCLSWSWAWFTNSRGSRLLLDRVVSGAKAAPIKSTSPPSALPSNAT